MCQRRVACEQQLNICQSVLSQRPPCQKQLSVSLAGLANKIQLDHIPRKWPLYGTWASVQMLQVKPEEGRCKTFRFVVNGKLPSNRIIWRWTLGSRKSVVLLRSCGPLKTLDKGLWIFVSYSTHMFSRSP